jgi:alcohol dehydrogenase
MERFALRYGSTVVYMGEGALSRLQRHLGAHRRILIVKGRRSAEESGALNDALEVVQRLGISAETYSGISPNPTDSMVDGIVEAVRAHGAEAILAIGGGSVIDSAKFAAVIACSGGRADDYLLGGRTPSCDMPVYAVNLTHGTGSEIDRYSVANVEGKGLKIGLETTYPRASADDPRYLRSLPADQTIYTGLDALYHALESSTSTETNRMTQTLAREAVELIARWLPAALRSPGDLEARGNLLYAAAVAGIAIDNSVTHIVHLLEHVLSGINPRLPHGAGLAMLGPRCIRYTYAARPIEGALVMRALDPGLEPIPEHAGRAEEALRRFQESLGFDEGLSDYGFSEGELEGLRARAMEILRGETGLVPFEVTEEIVGDIISSAFRGRGDCADGSRAIRMRAGPATGRRGIISIVLLNFGYIMSSHLTTPEATASSSLGMRRSTALMVAFVTSHTDL